MNVKQQFNQIKTYLNRFYENSGGTYTEEHCAYQYNLVNETDNYNVCLYYADDIEVWKITVLDPETLDEEIVYCEPEYYLSDMVTRFTNIYTALILEEQ